MGLDVGCECGKISFRAGSYSGFAIFREKLAKAVGINLNEMEGFYKNKEGSYEDGKQWTEQEPFYELLDHSDCDGMLTPKQCNQLSKDFKKYRDPVLQSLACGCERDYYTQILNRWIEAITHSEEDCCVLEFG